MQTNVIEVLSSLFICISSSRFLSNELSSCLRKVGDYDLVFFLGLNKDIQLAAVSPTADCRLSRDIGRRYNSVKTGYFFIFNINGKLFRLSRMTLEDHGVSIP